MTGFRIPRLDLRLILRPPVLLMLGCLVAILSIVILVLLARQHFNP